MPRVAFVSDLHLFARRSNGASFLPALREAAATSDHFILGGDIFDFRWSTIAPHAVFDSAISWLRELAESAPSCRFHFLLGNHDDHSELVSRLPALANELPNFDWERFVLRLGDCVFLHGDAADRKLTADRLMNRRERFRHTNPAAWRHDAYHWVLKTRIDQLVSRAAHPRRLVARRLLNYLRDVGHGPEDGVREVYFGHTHRALDAFRHGGVLFHNGGAPIGKCQFRILYANVADAK